MPTIIIKPEHDRDLYVAWSTVVDSPLAWGDRDWMWDYLDDDAAERLDRADANGTSAAGGYAWFGRWDYERFVYEQRGVLPRKHLASVCEALERGDEAAVWDLLEPFEDEAEVRRERH